jgi:HSP20 family protein
MASFFEKLKKGMGTEVESAENDEETKKSKRPEKNKEEVAKIREEKEEVEVKKEKSLRTAHQGFSLENLTKQEGELAVDLYQNEEELVIRSAIAGVRPEKLDILIEQDVIVISGNREEPEEKAKTDYFSRECYFGPFSRKIISPVEIDSSRAKAIMKEGVLIIRIPKIQREKKVKVEIAKE